MIDAHTRAYLNAYHRRHPWLFPAFVQAALKMKATGRTRYSAKTIMENLRWNHDIENPGSSEFKICNDVTAYYARKAAEAYPELKGFFRFKTVKGLNRSLKGQAQHSAINRKVDERTAERNLQTNDSTTGVQKALHL